MVFGYQIVVSVIFLSFYENTILINDEITKIFTPSIENKNIYNIYLSQLQTNYFSITHSINKLIKLNNTYTLYYTNC